MPAVKTVVHCTYNGNGDITFFFPNAHLLSDEREVFNVSNYRMAHNFNKCKFETRNLNFDEVFKYISLLMQHGFVAEGHGGPLKLEVGAVYFWSRPFDVQATVRQMIRY